MFTLLFKVRLLLNKIPFVSLKWSSTTGVMPDGTKFFVAWEAIDGVPAIESSIIDNVVDIMFGRSANTSSKS
jgi:hypothetical protein